MLEDTCEEKFDLKYLFIFDQAHVSVAEWFRALDLKSAGPWFKSSCLYQSGFVCSSPKFNPSAESCK